MGTGKFMTWRVGGVNITRVAELGGAPFLGTNKEKTARKYGVDGVNFLAYKR